MQQIPYQALKAYLLSGPLQKYLPIPSCRIMVVTVFVINLSIFYEWTNIWKQSHGIGSRFLNCSQRTKNLFSELVQSASQALSVDIVVKIVTKEQAWLVLSWYSKQGWHSYLFFVSQKKWQYPVSYSLSHSLMTDFWRMLKDSNLYLIFELERECHQSVAFLIIDNKM